MLSTIGGTDRGQVAGSMNKNVLKQQNFLLDKKTTETVGEIQWTFMCGSFYDKNNSTENNWNKNAIQKL